MTEVGEEEHGGVAEARGRGDSYDLAYGEIHNFYGTQRQDVLWIIKMISFHNFILTRNFVVILQFLCSEKFRVELSPSGTKNYCFLEYFHFITLSFCPSRAKSIRYVFHSPPLQLV